MLNYLIIDAFTSRAFAGNPAAVVRLDQPLDERVMQSIASEFNLAETAYLQPMKDGRFGLRWFTPTREVPLCGHATLASAHALWELDRAKQSEPIRFLTRHSGELTCRCLNSGWIQMDFPATPPSPAAMPPDAAKVFGISSPIECIGTTVMNLTLRLTSADQVRHCRPNLAILTQWHPVGVTVTAPADETGIDFVSRFFAPAAGVPEDSVTGSAHCALAPYWASQLKRNRFVARQLSPRGGELRVELHGDRVHLIGQAVTTMRGQITAYRGSCSVGNE
jgi:PhzF family phenazine biosynthesis protein